jgi:hypothetical protein
MDRAERAGIFILEGKRGDDKEENVGEGRSNLRKLGRAGEEEFYLLSNGSTSRMKMSIKWSTNGALSIYGQV